MKTIALLFTLFAAIAVSWSAYAQTPGANDTPNLSSAINTAATNQDVILPIIVMEDVPITTAIDNLARAADINYILDPKLSQSFQSFEPTVTFRLKNISGARAVKETLNRMLNLRKLVLNEDPVTHIARITRIGDPTNSVDASVLSIATNYSVTSTNGDLPRVEFQDVPLETALDELAKASGNKIEFDPRLRQTINGVNVEDNGVIVSGPKLKEYAYPANRWFNPMIVISAHWKNVSAMQALIAICQNFDLTLDKNDTNDVIQIKPIEVESRY